MKSKRREYVNIKSSAEGSIAELLATDERVRGSYFPQLFVSVRYNPKDNFLRFISLRELWEQGLFVKRYLEYPGVSSLECDRLFAELCVYLQQGEYVTHYIDRSKTDTFNNSLLITDISLEARKISFWSWTRIGTLEIHNMSFDEYFALYLSCIQNEQESAKFDIFRIVLSGKNCENPVEMLVENIMSGRICFVDRIYCLHKMKDENIEKSIQVLCEWFEIFMNTVMQLHEKGILSQEVLWEDVDSVLFAKDMIDISKKQFKKMLKRYNELLKRLEQSLIRRKTN